MSTQEITTKKNKKSYSSISYLSTLIRTGKALSTCSEYLPPLIRSDNILF